MGVISEVITMALVLLVVFGAWYLGRLSRKIQELDAIEYITNHAGYDSWSTEYADGYLDAMCTIKKLLLSNKRWED